MANLMRKGIIESYTLLLINIINAKVTCSSVTISRLKSTQAIFIPEEHNHVLIVLIHRG